MAGRNVREETKIQQREYFIQFLKKAKENCGATYSSMTTALGIDDDKNIRVKNILNGHSTILTKKEADTLNTHLELPVGSVWQGYIEYQAEPELLEYIHELQEKTLETSDLSLEEKALITKLRHLSTFIKIDEKTELSDHLASCFARWLHSVTKDNSYPEPKVGFSNINAGAALGGMLTNLLLLEREQIQDLTATFYMMTKALSNQHLQQKNMDTLDTLDKKKDKASNG